MGLISKEYNLHQNQARHNSRLPSQIQVL
jgi:hypothetical protein